MPFEKNVFINCPFDKEYLHLLRHLLFTILYFDLEPQISETRDGDAVRVENIKQLIRQSKYSIHDLSRSGPMHEGEYPRFNMPFELGLDIGCKVYGDKKRQGKICLILANTPYQYQRVLSDIAGQDISSHNDDKQRLILVVRSWFSRISGKSLDGPTKIWENYNEFTDNMNRELNRQGFSNDDIKELPFSDFIKIARQWLSEKKSV